MTQTATILTPTGSVQVELPSSDALAFNGVLWGQIEAFPTPAYWHYQVVSRRLTARPTHYKLGHTLAEELGACLLGGHGIPAKVGIAAYERLRKLGAFNTSPSQAELETQLREPLQVDGRPVRYRFAAQKAKYLAKALPLVHAAPEFQTGKQLRDWLIGLPGVGHKTASWVARNWLDADDVAILDVHIMRVGQALGIFPMGRTVERHYLELEAMFLEFSKAIDVRASELDAVIWHELASSSTAARFLTKRIDDVDNTPSSDRKARKTDRPIALLA